MARFSRLKAGLEGLTLLHAAGAVVVWLVLMIGTALKGFEWPIVMLVGILGLAGILGVMVFGAYLFHPHADSGTSISGALTPADGLAVGLVEQQRKHYEGVIEELKAKDNISNKAYSEAVDRLQNDLAKARGDVTAYQTSYSDDQATITDLRKRIEFQQKLEMNHAEISAGRKQGVIKTRKSDAVPPQPTPQEVVAIEAIRAYFRNEGGPAAGNIRSVLLNLRNAELRDVTFAWLLGKEDVALHSAADQMAQITADDSQVSLAEILASLVRFQEAYSSVVQCVHAAEKEGADLLEKNHCDAYRRWEESNTVLGERLRAMKEMSALAPIRGQLEKNGAFDSKHLRYATLFERGAKMWDSGSDDERTFLELFCGDEGILDPNKPETWIEHPVFAAGSDLTQKKLLVQTPLKNGKVRFCMPEPVRRGWALTGPSPSPRRDCIDIGLDTVRGSGGSGSGTPIGGGIHP